MLNSVIVTKFIKSLNQYFIQYVLGNILFFKSFWKLLKLYVFKQKFIIFNDEVDSINLLIKSSVSEFLIEMWLKFSCVSGLYDFPLFCAQISISLFRICNTKWNIHNRPTIIYVQQSCNVNGTIWSE